jgi:hypothetical protein
MEIEQLLCGQNTAKHFFAFFSLSLAFRLCKSDVDRQVIISLDIIACGA